MHQNPPICTKCVSNIDATAAHLSELQPGGAPELPLSLPFAMLVESAYDATASGFDPIRALNQLTRLRATGTE